MEELLNQDIPKNWPEKYLGLSWKKIIVIATLVIMVGVYIGILLFGDNSLEAYLQLEEYQEALKSEVGKIKEENALMQKEYFELNELTSKE